MGVCVSSVFVNLELQMSLTDIHVFPFLIKRKRIMSCGLFLSVMLPF